MASDLVNRDFTRSEPDRLWVTDITEHPTCEAMVYHAVVRDAFSRRVVSWPSTNTYTPCNKLVLQRLVEPGQFTSWAFTRRAIDSGLVPSMGSIGDCFDCEHDVGVVLVAPASRVPLPAALANPHPAGQRDLRVPRDLAQLPATAHHRLARSRQSSSKLDTQPTTAHPPHAYTTSMGPTPSNRVLKSPAQNHHLKTLQMQPPQPQVPTTPNGRTIRRDQFPPMQRFAGPVTGAAGAAKSASADDRNP